MIDLGNTSCFADGINIILQGLDDAFSMLGFHLVFDVDSINMNRFFPETVGDFFTRDQDEVVILVGIQVFNRG
jgi:hypothetical protein